MRQNPKEVLLRIDREIDRRKDIESGAVGAPELRDAIERQEAIIGTADTRQGRNAHLFQELERLKRKYKAVSHG